MTRFRLTRSFRVDPITASLIAHVSGRRRAPSQPLFQLWGCTHWSQVQVRETLEPALSVIQRASVRYFQQAALIRLLHPEQRGSPAEVDDPCWRAVLTTVESHLSTECPSARGQGGHHRFKAWAGFNTYMRIALLRQHGVEAWWQANRFAPRRGVAPPAVPFEARQLAPVAEQSGQALAASRRVQTGVIPTTNAAIRDLTW